MARQNLLDARTVNYLELIGNGKSYAVPPYQRDYSWGREEWDDLWDDIRELRRSPGDRHYMGAVVVQAQSDRKFLVIDGQQRLATLSLFALAAISTLEAMAANGASPDENKTRAAELRGRFVGERDPATLIETSRLSLNQTDDGLYQDYLVQLRDPSNARSLPRSGRRMWECFRYFRDRLGGLDSIRDDGAGVAKFLTETVSRQILFILITVEDDLNAYTVFETLNARGVDLTTTDLLKNYLFSLIEGGRNLVALQRRWRTLVGTVRQERFPDFLRYHLLTEQTKIRSAQLFKIVRKEVQQPRHVFALMENLDRRADLFAAISDANHEYWSDLPEAKTVIRELVLLRVTQIMPLVFATREKFSREDFRRVLKMLSVVSFRYNLVSDRSRSELEPAYARAAKAVGDGAAKSPGQVFSLLRPIYVEDDKMEQDFATLQLKTSGQRKRVVRYVLARLETETSGNDIDPETDRGTIEHILPENPGAEWERAFPPDGQEAYRYRIGNLTLLERRLNRDIGNAPYARKVEAYRGSKYALTGEIAKIARQDWTPEQLEERQRHLAERAVRIWRSDFV